MPEEVSLIKLAIPSKTVSAFGAFEAVTHQLESRKLGFSGSTPAIERSRSSSLERYGSSLL